MKPENVQGLPSQGVVRPLKGTVLLVSAHALPDQPLLLLHPFT